MTGGATQRQLLAEASSNVSNCVDLAATGGIDPYNKTNAMLIELARTCHAPKM
jgi:hypothetical protein